MSYIAELADAIRLEVADALVPDEDADLLFVIYAVLLLAKGANVTSADVHNAWSAWMTHRGEDHESLVPFSDLSTRTRVEDQPFVAAIRRVAQREVDRYG